MEERYQLLGRLPGGGFGRISVYFDRQMNQKVVQKALHHPTRENCEDLIREGRLYIKLKDEEHIVDLIAYRFDYTDPCLILPFYEEGTLQTKVGNRNWYDSIIFVQHAAKGVSALHSEGGFARDIKPANLFISKNAQGQRIIKVGDLGLGRLPYPFTNGDMTRNAFGTPGYMAPELFAPNPQFTPACDIYSLGVTGIELITGSRDINSIHSIWINNDVKSLLLRMTSYNPHEGPDAITVVNTIRKIVQAYDESFKKVVTVGGLSLLGWLLYKGATSK
jgi:serine/threonine-protein kinase